MSNSKNWINALTGFVNPGNIILFEFSNPGTTRKSGFQNPGNIILSGFSNPGTTRKSGFPNPGEVLFNGYLSNPFLTMLHIILLSGFCL